MKLYTRTGDRGETGLIGGRRVWKNHLRVAAYGDVDELCAAIGSAAASLPSDERPTPGDPAAGVADVALPPLGELLPALQADLFVVGSGLADPAGTHPVPPIGPAEIGRLESWIDAAVAPVPPLTSFILPGGSETAARLHLARAVCRRAERSVVTLLEQGAADVNDCIAYLNRLADLLFALARLANHLAGVPDVPWAPRRPR